MGFKDAEWAYSLDLPMAQKVVLVAICHRTDDVTHMTLVGQQTISEMVGMSVRSVHRAVAALDEMGILVRESRRGRGGYRTSDSITVHTAYMPQSQVTERQVTEGHVTEGPVLHDTLSTPTCHSVHSHLTQCHDDGHSEGQSDGQPVGQPDLALEALIEPPPDVIDRFDEFYAAWPKKRDKPAARRAWAKATKATSPDTIIAAATAYRDNPFITAKQFIPYPASWLNAEGWADELDGPRENRDRPTPTERAMQTLAAGRNVINQRQGPLATVTTLNPRKELSS